MIKLLATLTVSLLLVQTSFVQVASASDSHEQAAIDLIELMDLERQMLAGANVMIDTMTQQAPQMAQFKDVIVAWSESFMTWEVFGPQVIAIYVDAFSEQELRDLISFYKTPTGQKTLAVMPELMSRTAQLGVTEAQKRQSDLERRIRERAAEIADSGSGDQ